MLHGVYRRRPLFNEVVQEMATLEREHPFESAEFPDALYLVGPEDAVRSHVESREARGVDTPADWLLLEVAGAFELRHEIKRGEDPPTELRAALMRVAATALAWVEAIDQTGEQDT